MNGANTWGALQTLSSGASFPNGSANTVGSTATWTFNNQPTFGNGAFVNGGHTVTFQSGATLQINASTGVQTTFVNTGNSVSGSWTLSGTTPPVFGAQTFGSKSQLSGTMNSSNDTNANWIQCSTDNLAYSGTGGVNCEQILHYVGASAIGPRRALDISISNTAAPAGIVGFMSGIRVLATANYSMGGTVGSSAGSPYGGAFAVIANAPYLSGVGGLELDLKTTSAATQLNNRGGLAVHINAGSPTQGVYLDSAFEISMDPGYSTDAGFKSLWQIGKVNAVWPVDPTSGWLLKTVQQTQNGANLDSSAVRAQAAAGGFDLWQIAFSTAAWRSSGVVLQNGSAEIGPALFSYTSSGAKIDVVGTIGAISSVATAGASYDAGDTLYDGYGGQIVVDTVNGSGNITAAHYSIAPYYFGTGPATVTTTGGSGNAAATFNVTWAAKTQLALNPSGGAIVTSLPTSCTSMPTGTLWNNSGVVNVCP
jgi:hypothetical protein